MKKIISMLLVCLLALSPCMSAAAFCGGKGEETLRLVVPEDWEMDIGDSRSVESVFSESVSNRVLTWTAEPASVATVDEWGRVTAVGEGEATITAENSDGVKDSVTLTVVKTATKGVVNKAKHDYALEAVSEVTNLQKLVDRYAINDAKDVPENVKDTNGYKDAQTATTADGAVWTITNYGVLRTDSNAPTERDKE